MAQRTNRGNGHGLTAVMRADERVMPLELFFDLVFVLAFTQCSTLMAETPTGRGVAQGVLVLAVLWWSWTGYAWLTSVVDPEEGSVRLVLFAAMAGLLVVALCVPEAFGDEALTLAIAYGVVRGAHIALFVVASRGEANLRRSVTGLGVSTAIGVGLLIAAAFADGWTQGGLWVLALLVDLGGPFIFGAEGWKLEPRHFVERHGLIVLIALGETIVALGVGSAAGVDAGVITAAVLGVALVSAMWWAYFDVNALLAGRRLMELSPGRERNELARDAYSLLHFPLVAGVVLLALGLEKTLAHVDQPLHDVPAAAMTGGLALYVAALVAFKYRSLHAISIGRVVATVALLACYPVVREVDALVSLALVTAVMVVLVAYETVHYADLRDQIRHAPEGG
jgi:low temperature requirement protein LtrA